MAGTGVSGRRRGRADGGWVGAARLRGYSEDCRELEGLSEGPWGLEAGELGG